MSDNLPIDETDERIEFSDRDVEELNRLGITEGDVPEFHPILEVWDKVLDPAAKVASEKISPQWANRICGAYREINYADMAEYARRYFAKLEALHQILRDEIASDSDCLTYDQPEDDAKENRGHYLNLLLLWQQTIMQWELEWECADPDAPVEIAAIAEVHKMFLGEQGLTGLLEQIPFEFTDADSQVIGAALIEQRAEFLGDTEEG